MWPIITFAVLVVIGFVLYVWTRRNNRKILSEGSNHLSATPADSIRPISIFSITPRAPSDQTTTIEISRNDLPPSYEEIQEVSLHDSGSQSSLVGTVRPSDIWVAGMMDQSQESDNPPPTYWISTHQTPEYPGVR